MWFKLIADFFQSKRIKFAIEKTEKQYASAPLGFGSMPSSLSSTPQSDQSQFDDNKPLQTGFV
jgi:hypothetical protein